MAQRSYAFIYNIILKLKKFNVQDVKSSNFSFIFAIYVDLFNDVATIIK